MIELHRVAGTAIDTRFRVFLRSLIADLTFTVNWCWHRRLQRFILPARPAAD